VKNPLVDRLSAAVQLFRLTAWQFSYLDAESARILTSDESVEDYRLLIDAASKGKPFLVDECGALREALARYPAEKRSSDLRQEYTRLFNAHPILISLNGSAWVKERTLVSRKKGEAFAVGQYYKELGLVNQDCVRDSYDHLVSELDFVSYVTSAEAEAWGDDNADSACGWRDLREDFVGNHMAEFAESVSLKIQRETENPFILFSAQLLAGLVKLPL
jgi:TorA maturation chaperone TorD